MNDLRVNGYRRGARGVGGWWSCRRVSSDGRRTLLIAVLILASAVTVRHQPAEAEPAEAQPAVLARATAQASQQAQPVNYRIRGDATVEFDYSSEAGLKELAKCSVPYVRKWHLVLDGTLDSVGQTVTGTFEFTGPGLDKVEEWQSALRQCGPEMHGRTECNIGCGPSWVQYRYAAYTGFPPGGTFRGTYDSEGNITILGSTTLGARYLFLDCSVHTTQDGVSRSGSVPCEEVLGFTPHPPPPDLDAPRNASYAIVNYGVGRVVITGKLIFNDDLSGVSIRGNLDLPDSAWADCCIVSDPLFLSPKNHVSIQGDAVRPGQE